MQRQFFLEVGQVEQQFLVGIKNTEKEIGRCQIAGPGPATPPTST